MLQMSALSIHDLDNNPFRLDDRLLADAGMARVGDEIIDIRGNHEPRLVAAKQSWLERIAERLRPSIAWRLSF